jgi:uncharacterized protein YutE (UPF0331/DUF86 family)
MINEKLKRLEENLRVLGKFKDDYTLEDVIADKVDEWALRYGLLESIQIIIDLSCSFVAEKNLGIPKNYSECIMLIVSNKYLDKDLGERIMRMVGLRNLLVHEYGIIDVQRLYEYLDHLNDIRDFAIAISK